MNIRIFRLYGMNSYDVLFRRADDIDYFTEKLDELGIIKDEDYKWNLYEESAPDIQFLNPTAQAQFELYFSEHIED